MCHSKCLLRPLFLIVAITAVGCLLSGCSETPTAGPAAGEKTDAENTDPGPVPDGQTEPEPEATNEEIPLPLPDQSNKTPSPTGSPTHVVTQQVAYYKAGPQQAIPPDGKIETGTKVRIIRNAGSYTEIQTENGVRGYISSDSLKQLETRQ